MHCSAPSIQVGSRGDHWRLIHVNKAAKVSYTFDSLRFDEKAYSRPACWWKHESCSPSELAVAACCDPSDHDMSTSVGEKRSSSARALFNHEVGPPGVVSQQEDGSSCGAHAAVRAAVICCGLPPYTPLTDATAREVVAISLLRKKLILAPIVAI